MGDSTKFDPYDCVGKTFRNWTVLELAGGVGSRGTRYRCRCKCGASGMVLRSYLKYSKRNHCTQCCDYSPGLESVKPRKPREWYLYGKYFKTEN